MAKRLRLHLDVLLTAFGTGTLDGAGRRAGCRSGTGLGIFCREIDDVRTIDRDLRRLLNAVVRLPAVFASAGEVCNTDLRLAGRTADSLVIPVILELFILVDVDKRNLARLNLEVIGNIIDPEISCEISRRLAVGKDVARVDRLVVIAVSEDVLGHRNDHHALLIDRRAVGDAADRMRTRNGVLVAARAVAGRLRVAGGSLRDGEGAVVRDVLATVESDTNFVSFILGNAAFHVADADKNKVGVRCRGAFALFKRIGVVVMRVRFGDPILADVAEMLGTADAAVVRGVLRHSLIGEVVVHIGLDGVGNALEILVPLLAGFARRVIETAIGVLADEHCLAERTIARAGSVLVAGDDNALDRLKDSALVILVIIPIIFVGDLLIEVLRKTLPVENVLALLDIKRELLFDHGDQIGQIDRKILFGKLNALRRGDLVDLAHRLKIDGVIFDAGVGAVGASLDDLVKTIRSRIDDTTLVDGGKLGRELLIAEHTHARCLALFRVGRRLGDVVSRSVVTDGLDRTDDTRGLILLDGCDVAVRIVALLIGSSIVIGAVRVEVVPALLRDERAVRAVRQIVDLGGIGLAPGVTDRRLGFDILLIHRIAATIADDAVIARLFAGRIDVPADHRVLIVDGIDVDEDLGMTCIGIRVVTAVAMICNDVAGLVEGLDTLFVDDPLVLAELNDVVLAILPHLLVIAAEIRDRDFNFLAVGERDDKLRAVCARSDALNAVARLTADNAKIFARTIGIGDDELALVVDLCFGDTLGIIGSDLAKRRGSAIRIGNNELAFGVDDKRIDALRFRSAAGHRKRKTDHAADNKKNHQKFDSQLSDSLNHCLFSLHYCFCFK